MNSDSTTDEVRRKPIWSKAVDLFMNREDEFDDDYDDEEVHRETKRPVTLRLQSTKVSHVAVRQPQSIEDARIAADGLKDGRQQIVNLEKTEQAMSERIIDFLNGVTYALNGFVEKVGDRVYLFAPSNVVIDVSEDLRKSGPGIFDKEI